MQYSKLDLCDLFCLRFLAAYRSVVPAFLAQSCVWDPAGSARR